jgi:hypothetical protein
VRTRGEPESAEALAEALLASDSDETQDLTHGFHTYPGRMHPRLARELIARWAEPSAVVLDPFCGSGTVLVESLVAGCKPQGVDLNPLALRISSVHCALRDASARRRFVRQSRHVAEASEERVRSRAKANLPEDRSLSQYYAPHVFIELSGLRDEVVRTEDDAERQALLIVWSSLLVKFSNKRADTSEDHVEKRIRKGLVSEFFARKAAELALRWEALYEAAPQDAFDVRLECGDARRLHELLGPRFRADLIVSSPPYGGTYDYVQQHALRNAWFDLDTSEFRENEIGARRSLQRTTGGQARWNAELSAVLQSLRSVVHDGSHVILWMGDAELTGQRISADEQVAGLAPGAGFTLVAAAAQSRPNLRGGPDRFEHLLLLAPISQGGRRSRA